MSVFQFRFIDLPLYGRQRNPAHSSPTNSATVIGCVVDCTRCSRSADSAAWAAAVGIGRALAELEEPHIAVTGTTVIVAADIGRRQACSTERHMGQHTAVPTEPSSRHTAVGQVGIVVALATDIVDITAAEEHRSGTKEVHGSSAETACHLVQVRSLYP